MNITLTHGGDVHLHIHDDTLTTSLLRQLLEQGTQLMASVQELKDELVEVKAGVQALKAAGVAKVDELQAKIAELTAQLASGVAVTQADLDGLDAQVDEINAALKGDAPVDPVDPNA